jgi:nucleoid DNA-binding protein
MHHLIASYLFQNRTCPLPGLGTLTIHTNRAETNFTNQLITAPEPVVQFKDSETNATGLLNYIARKTNSNTDEVTEALHRFCNNIKNEISLHAKASLGSIGNFIADSNGNIIFKQSVLHEAFLQPVTAERVIHPKAEHTMLVGDKETTNTVMSEYFNETPATKDRWWVWAIVLGVIGLLIVLYYFSGTNVISSFGNTIKI